MSDDDLLNELMQRTGGKKNKRPSRLDDIRVERRDVDKATGRSRSEGTKVISFRVPAHIADAAERAAREARIPFSEAKKAMFYQGLAWILEGNEPEMEYDRNITAVPPSV